MPTPRRLLVPLLLSLLTSSAPAPAATARPDALERGFAAPPESAKPRIWWHWVNGNVTKEGITLDLESIKRVGIGGVQIFDAARDAPVVVEKRIISQSPEWFEMLRFAAAECDRLGLEMTLHGSGGWSESGGPWVRLPQAMQKYVWSELRVTGPRKFANALPLPPSESGPFQGVLWGKYSAYKDSAVLAYRTPVNDVSAFAAAKPQVKSNAAGAKLNALIDGAPFPYTKLAPDTKDRLFVQLEFAQPFAARALTMNGFDVPTGELQASNDGKIFQNVGRTLTTNRRGIPMTTVIPPTSARYFKLVFDPAPAGKPAYLGELALESGDRVHHWQQKAAFGTEPIGPPPEATAAPSPAGIIAAGDVVDLTARTNADGILSWEVPAGSWTIMRLGHSPTGWMNGPAPPENTGLESDKLSREAVNAYLDGFLNPIASALGPLVGKSFRYVLLDSWEAGTQNWTPHFIDEFKRRRGYDPVRYFPALTGRFVGSPLLTERFLWDVRLTIADLVADNHYSVFHERLSRMGLGLYGEAVGIGMPMIADQLQTRGRTDIPMGEWWMPVKSGPPPSAAPDAKEAASAGHIYGKNIIAAEAFTTGSDVPQWGRAPYGLKAIADVHMAEGINRIVLHEYAHQPFRDRKPGMALAAYGTQFSRMVTWWENAGAAFMSYLSRSQFLLQQGLFVGDALYFYGEGAPNTVSSRGELEPALPPGFDYDFINGEVLLTRVTTSNGQITLPDGNSYRVLVLPESKELSLPVLRKIRDLVRGGATVVVGRKPIRAPGLTGYPQADAEVVKLAGELWGNCGETACEHTFGRGKLISKRPMADVLAAMGSAPDFTFSSPDKDARFANLHRRTSDADIYFVANLREIVDEVELSFRVDGKEPELWHPETGKIEPAAPHTGDSGRTKMSYRFEPLESVFVVFRRPAGKDSGKHPARNESAAPTSPIPPAVPIAGPWEVRFPPKLGAPEKVTLDRLASWTTHADDGVKYFSGTATYVASVAGPARGDLKAGETWYLDLGGVKEIAEVTLNGKKLGTLWKPPFRVDVTGTVRPGQNRLEVKITNLWPNRLIGDAGLPEGKRLTWTHRPFYKKDDPLLESGLLGPVTFVPARLVAAQAGR